MCADIGKRDFGAAGIDGMRFGAVPRTWTPGATLIVFIIKCNIDLRLRVMDQVTDPAVQYPPQYFVELQLFRGCGIELLDFGKESRKHWHVLSDPVERKKAGLISVIQIGGVVGEFISRVDQLRLERRPLVEPIF